MHLREVTCRKHESNIIYVYIPVLNTKIFFVNYQTVLILIGIKVQQVKCLEFKHTLPYEARLISNSIYFVYYLEGCVLISKQHVRIKEWRIGQYIFSILEFSLKNVPVVYQ